MRSMASVVIGVLFGVTALSIAVRRDTILNTSTAALVLTLAIVSHHFTAMGAVEIVPDPTRVISTLSIAPLGLALGIANAALTVLGMSIVASLMDRRLRDNLIAAGSEFQRNVYSFTRRTRHRYNAELPGERLSKPELAQGKSRCG